MYKFSKVAGSVIVATAALGGASAALADGYNAPRVRYEQPSDWSGFYFGLGSGYQWSGIDVTHVPSNVNVGAGSANNGIGIASDHGEWFGSAHIGVQHQFGNIVLGVEGGWMSTLRGNGGSSDACDSVPAVLSNPIIAPGNFCSARLQDILTIGARAGWAAGHWMPYVTGGYANGGFDFENRIPTTAALGFTQLQETAHTRLGGWYVGGGFEWIVSPGWTTGIEYRHYDFSGGNTTAYCGSTGGTSGCAPLGSALERVKMDASTDTIEARVTWRFGRDYGTPLK